MFRYERGGKLSRNSFNLSVEDGVVGGKVDNRGEIVRVVESIVTGFLVLFLAI